MSNKWQYYTLKMLSWLVCLCPYPWVLLVGKHLGRIYYRMASKQRLRAIRQIEDRLGLTPEVAQQTIASLFMKLGQTFLEVLYTPAMTKQKMQECVTIENRHYLDEAMASGRGVVLLAAHIGNWEWLGASLAMAGFPVASVIKPQPNKQHTKLLNEYRQLAGIELFTRGTTELISAARALKEGRLVGLLADQDAGPNGLFIEFLGKMSSTPVGAAVFAKKFKVPVIPVFIVRKAEGGHRVIMHEPLYDEETGNKDDDIYQLTTKMTNIIDATIRQYPDEWLWFQKRWNTSQPKERVGEQA